MQAVPPIKKILFTGLVLSLLFLMSGIAPANEKKGFDAKRQAFCKMMLTHAEESSALGDDEKAGYYFQQAVNADPSRMAKTWFQMKEGNASEAGITPQPPAETQEDGGVIMGDDEGC
jgi:Tfp pilus assembly protein PilF